MPWKWNTLIIGVILLCSVFFCKQQAVAANLDKCRYKIGEHAVEECLCNEASQLRCDLARAQELVARLQGIHASDSLINDAAELERIIDHLIDLDVLADYAVFVRDIVKGLTKAIVLKNIDEIYVFDNIVIDYCKIANYAGYYGGADEQVLPNLQDVYKRYETEVVESYRRFEKRGVMRDSVGGGLISLIRTTIYRIDPSALPPCPDIFLKYKPELCEIRSGR